MIGVPTRLRQAVTLERFSVEALDRVFSIKSATVAMGENRVDVSGRVDATADRFRVDAAVRGDTVVIPLGPAGAGPSSSTSTKADDVRAAESILEQIPVSGQIRVDIANVRVGKLKIFPLIANASLENARLVLGLQRASLCNISLAGGLTVERSNISLKVRAQARNASIEESIPCLTDQRIRLTGKMDADAHVTAVGTFAELSDSVRGTYRLRARNGRIEKFDVLAKVFSVLNLTEVVHGKLPDLTRSELGYDSANVDGRIEGRTMHIDQAVLDTDVAKIVAHGKVQYWTGALEANVLVAPLKTIDYVLNWIPVLRRILGGTLLALPVRVTGTVNAPRVLPLAPQAVASRLIDIFTNTMKLPVDLVNTILPKSKPTPDAGTVGR